MLSPSLLVFFLVSWKLPQGPLRRFQIPFQHSHSCLCQRQGFPPGLLTLHFLENRESQLIKNRKSSQRTGEAGTELKPPRFSEMGAVLPTECPFDSALCRFKTDSVLSLALQGPTSACWDSKTGVTGPAPAHSHPFPHLPAENLPPDLLQQSPEFLHLSSAPKNTDRM